VDQEFRELHAKWLERGEEGQKVIAEIVGNDVEAIHVSEDAAAAEVTLEEVETTETHVTPIPCEVTPTVRMEFVDMQEDTDYGPGIVENYSPGIVDNYGSEVINDTPPTTTESPLSSSISTISDWTPGEPREVIRDYVPEVTYHETFYFRDGDVEVACGNTIFRVHSTVLSFSSSVFRDIFSQRALLHAPTPEGTPRITMADSAEGFAVLLKMIYVRG